MQLSRVLHKEWIRHECEHGIGAAEFREAALLRRIVDGRKTSRRPAGDCHCGVCELIYERLRIAGSAGISRGTEHQGRKRCC